MKRSGPPRRKTPLKPTGGLSRKTSLARSSPGKTPRKTARAAEMRQGTASVSAPEGLTALEWRRAVWELDGGRCVMTGMSVPRDADLWTWSPHHPIPKQVLPAGYRYDPRAGVVLTKRAHERHELAVERVPLEWLPARVLELAAELGPAFEDRLRRYHPSSA